MTAIVIPAADVVPDADKLLQALLYSIERQKIHETFSVVVCFDSCKPGFAGHFQKQFPFIEAVINHGNRLNFAGNVNRGIRYACRSGSVGVLCVNQDCVLPLSYSVEAISGEGIAVATPVNVCREPPLTEADLAALYASQPSEIVRTPHKKLIGFCMYLSPALLDKVGLFDESTFKATFEDDDICARALLAGFPVEHVNVNVHHYGSRCGAYDGELLWLSSVAFRRKWQIPLDVEHAQFNEWISQNHKWHPQMKES